MTINLIITPWKWTCSGSRPGPAQSTYLLGELDDQWELIGLDEAQEVLFAELTIKRVTAFVKLKHTNGKTGYVYFYTTREFTDVEVPILMRSASVSNSERGVAAECLSAALMFPLLAASKPHLTLEPGI